MASSRGTERGFLDTPPYLLLRYVVIPVWLLAGFLDWLQHRRHAIAMTSGPTESVFHLVLLAEMGIAMTLVLFCEMTTLLFAVLLGACLLHSATAYADTRYASPRRTIGCFEQFVHGYLEVLPYTALLLLATAHWPAFTALFGAGVPDWSLQLRENPPDLAYLCGVAGAALLLVFAPFVEELQRGRRAKRDSYVGFATMR